MENIKQVKIQYLNNNAHYPVKATLQSAGYDIHSAEELIINPGEYKAVSTGLSIEMPKEMEAQIRPRSGLALKHGVTVLNSPGTIDSDYRGEIKIILINHATNPFHVKVGERVAQMVFSTVINVDLVKSDNLESSERGVGGFGSTGTHKLI